jgi:hypothetical protein
MHGLHVFHDRQWIVLKPFFCPPWPDSAFCGISCPEKRREGHKHRVGVCGLGLIEGKNHGRKDR